MKRRGEHTTDKRSSRLLCRVSIGSRRRDSITMDISRDMTKVMGSSSMVVTMATDKISTEATTRAMEMEACRMAMDMSSITTEDTNSNIRKIMGTKSNQEILGRLQTDAV